MPFASRYLLNEKPVSLRKYFLRRLTRLEPPYIINMVMLAPLVLLINRVPARQVLEHLAASVTYVHNIVYGTGSLINGVAWSLEVEVQFYVLAPVLALLFTTARATARRMTIRPIGVFAALQRVYSVHSYGFHLGNQFPDYFLAGFMLADLYATSWKSNARPVGARANQGVGFWLRRRLVLPRLVADARAADLRPAA